MNSRFLAACNSLSRPAQIAAVKPSPAPINKRYIKSSAGGEKASERKSPAKSSAEERAPSTAEEFERVAEKKMKESESAESGRKKSPRSDEQ